MPMDETLGLAVVDFGGRAAAVVDTKVRAARVGDLQVELVDDFFEGFARGARANVHARVLYGRSSHHKIEALFKAFARALRGGVLPRSSPGPHAAEHQGPLMIAIVDYGAGNLNSVKKAFDYLGAESTVTNKPELVLAAQKIVLPGWGIFPRSALCIAQDCDERCWKSFLPGGRFSESASGCNGFSRAVRSAMKFQARDFSPATAGSFRLP